MENRGKRELVTEAFDAFLRERVQGQEPNGKKNIWREKRTHEIEASEVEESAIKIVVSLKIEGS